MFSCRDHFTKKERSPALFLQYIGRGSTQQAHRAQQRQTFTRHLTALVTRSDERANGCQAIMITHTRHEEQSLNITLLEDILDLGSLQNWIDRDQDQASFGRCHLQERPLRQVGSPDSNMVSFVEPQSHQPFSDSVGSLTVALVGPANVECLTELRITRVNQSFPIRKCFSLTV